MKRQKKINCIILIIMIIFLLGIPKTWAIEDTSSIEKVEYTEEFKKWLELTEEEKENVLQPRMYDIPYTNIVPKNPLYQTRMLGASLSSKYSLKNIISSNLVIRDQQETNSCWAFAALSSLETNLALSNYKKGTNLQKVYDFSERHMEYANSKVFANNVENKRGYNRRAGNGGNWYMAESYFTNGSGAIPEEEMLFENNEDIINITEIQNKTISSQVYDTVEFPDYSKETDVKKAEIIQAIKQHIQNYGSVFACMHGNSSSSSLFTCYNNDTGAKYCNNTFSHKADHAVSIIGWDDNYSKDRFAKDAKPASNGAWIIRNSWGERQEYLLSDLQQEMFDTNRTYCIENGWIRPSMIPSEFFEELGYTVEGNSVYQKIGDNGIMYVSYEDCNISSTLFGVEKATDKINYENIYQYDEFFPGYCITINSPNVMLSNVFEKQTSETEYLTQVSLYAPETYTCKVYVNPNGSSQEKSDLQLVSLKAGESETFNAGYHTLEFSQPIPIKSSNFVVAIEITGTDSKEVMISLETPIDEIQVFDNVTIQNHKCFVSYNNNVYDLSNWEQQVRGTKNGDSSIKAFTISNSTYNSLDSIEITTPPTRTSYIEGEDFDPTGMEITAKYNNNTSKVLESSSYQITNGTNLKFGQTSVTITYEDQSVNQTIKVDKNSMTELKIKTPPTKTEYKEGENFDKQGMVIEATYQNGTTKIISDYKMENAYNIKGDQTQITISYGGKTIEQPITVTPNPLVEIKITKQSDKTQYIEGENFNKTGMVITGIYQDGSEYEIVEYMVENGMNLRKEQTFITIKYEEKTTMQPIMVEEKAENSNLESIQCEVKGVQAYYYTDDSKTEYALIHVEIDNIDRILENDTFEYYYYLSANKEEQNIENWIKITDKQSENDKLQFTVDTRDILNYRELASERVAYLYIKEVVTKGTNQSIAISKGIKLDADIEIQTYMDDVLVQDRQIAGAENGAKDHTLANKILPHTGMQITIMAIILISGVGIFIYVRYKKLSKYVK